MDFYNTYVKLCRELGVSPSQCAVDAGLSKASVSRWKKGGGCTDLNIEILSAYFTQKLGRPISASYLKGEPAEFPSSAGAAELPENVKTMAAALAIALQQQKKPEQPPLPEWQRLEHPHRYVPYSCRHTFASLAAKAKVDKEALQRAIGHQIGSSVTDDYYISQDAHISAAQEEFEKMANEIKCIIDAT